MIAIRSPADLTNSRLPENLHRVVSRILTDLLDGGTYNPDDDGFIIVITPSDSDAYLSDRLGKRYQDSMFEGITYDRESRTWHVVYLQNNQYTMSLVISNAEWLDQGIRQRIIHGGGAGC